MSLLTDTNIFIEFWKHPSPELIHQFEKEDIVICGVIRSELLHGAVSEKNLNEISHALSCFPCYEMATNDWDKLGRMLFLLRTKGLTVPFPDAIIAYLAIKNQLTIWSNDNHFHMIQKVYPELLMYE